MNIAIFGWFGALPRHLDKYKDLFYQLNATNVYIHPSSIRQCVTHRGWKAMRNNPPEWINADIDLAILFSGGVFPYINYRIACNNFKPGKLIYDSGIFFPTPRHITNYLQHRLPACSRTLFPTQAANLMVDALWRMQKYQWRERLGEFERYFSCECEKLIINSLEDPLILRPELDRFMQRNPGGKITEHIFSGSSHVQHYRQYPRQYAELVGDFMYSTT